MHGLGLPVFPSPLKQTIIHSSSPLLMCTAKSLTHSLCILSTRWQCQVLHL